MDFGSYPSPIALLIVALILTALFCFGVWFDEN